MDNTTPTQRIPPNVGGVVVLTAVNLAVFACLVTFSAAGALASGLLRWLSPYLVAAIEAVAATHPVAGLLLSLLLCGMVCAFLLAVFWVAVRVVAIAVYRKTVPALLRWRQRRSETDWR